MEADRTPRVRSGHRYDAKTSPKTSAKGLSSRRRKATDRCPKTPRRVQQGHSDIGESPRVSRRPVYLRPATMAGFSIAA